MFLFGRDPGVYTLDVKWLRRLRNSSLAASLMGFALLVTTWFLREPADTFFAVTMRVVGAAIFVCFGVTAALTIRIMHHRVKNV
jgi:hypothetical protein